MPNLLREGTPVSAQASAGPDRGHVKLAPLLSANLCKPVASGAAVEVVVVDVVVDVVVTSGS